MGICCSTDNTPAVPEVIIPDPEFGESCEFTINRCGWSGTSRDHQAYRTHDAPKEMNRWLFLNKSGSKWGGKCKITVENFVREDPEKPKQGQILWEAHFVDTPFFQEYLRVDDRNAFDMMMHQVHEMHENNFIGGFMGGGHDHRRWGNDSFYLHSGGSWDRDYVTTLLMNWTMNTSASLRTETRAIPGTALTLGVYAAGTAICRYFEVETPIYREEGEGANKRRVQVGTSKQWERHIREFIDVIQFSLCDAQSQAPIAMPDGSPAVWSLPGQECDWTDNFDCPFFTVTQTGGWLTTNAPRITTKSGVDPALALLIAHLTTSEFSARAIKADFHPHFPSSPIGAMLFGFQNKAPPPPPVMIVGAAPVPYPLPKGYCAQPDTYQPAQPWTPVAHA